MFLCVITIYHYVSLLLIVATQVKNHKILKTASPAQNIKICYYYSMTIMISYMPKYLVRMGIKKYLSFCYPGFVHYWSSQSHDG